MLTGDCLYKCACGVVASLFPALLALLAVDTNIFGRFFLFMYMCYDMRRVLVYILMRRDL